MTSRESARSLLDIQDQQSITPPLKLEGGVASQVKKNRHFKAGVCDGPWERAAKTVKALQRRLERRGLAEVAGTGKLLAASHGARCKCGKRAIWDAGTKRRVCPVCESHYSLDTGEVHKVIVSKSILPRVALCRRQTVNGRVEIVKVGESADGSNRVGIFGLRKCGSAWRCPECAKAQMIKDATALHAINLGWRESKQKRGARTVYMITLTVPHTRRDKLEPLRRAVTRAFTRAHTGKAWIGARKSFGIKQIVRRLEVTTGNNGPHPHCHALVFVDGKLTKPQCASLRSWYIDHWSAAAMRQGLGKPNHEAVALTVADKDGAYIAKMGLLELAGDFQKIARCTTCNKQQSTHWNEATGRRVCDVCENETNRNPWQILADYHAHKQPRDRRLWLEYYEQIKGARRLTWSRFKDGLNLREMFPVEKLLALDFKDEPDRVCVHGKTWMGLTLDKKQDLIDARMDGDKYATQAVLGPDWEKFTAAKFDEHDKKPQDLEELRIKDREELQLAGLTPPKRRRSKVYVYEPQAVANG